MSHPQVQFATQLHQSTRPLAFSNPLDMKRMENVSLSPPLNAPSHRLGSQSLGAALCESTASGAARSGWLSLSLAQPVVDSRYRASHPCPSRRHPGKSPSSLPPLHT
jgi:hypothetical protein